MAKHKMLRGLCAYAHLIPRKGYYLRYCKLKCQWVAHSYCNSCPNYVFSDARGNVDVAQRRLTTIMGELEDKRRERLEQIRREVRQLAGVEE